MDITKTNKGTNPLANQDAYLYATKAQKEIDAMWDKGIINEDTINQWSAEHMRTPYCYAENRY